MSSVESQGLRMSEAGLRALRRGEQRGGPWSTASEHQATPWPILASKH